MASQAHGRWGRAQEVAGTAALSPGDAEITAISCPSAGNCLAGGSSGGSWYSMTSPLQPRRAFVVEEHDGIWGSAQPVPGLPAATDITVSAVSCASVGNCGVAGGYDIQGTVTQPTTYGAFVASQANGQLGSAQPVPGLAALKGDADGLSYSSVDAISCASAGNCTAAGTYTNKTGGTSVFAVSQTTGVWHAAHPITGSAGSTAGSSDLGSHEVSAISCASAGNCVLVGSIYIYNHYPWGKQAFVANQTHGTWGKADPVPGISALNTGGGSVTTAVSCP